MTPARYAKLHRSGYRLTVCALAYQRKVKALHAIGYTRAQLAEHTGLTGGGALRYLANGRAKRLDLDTAARIDKAYDELHMKPIHHTADAKRIKAWARKQKWATPFAYDDINDMNELPTGALI